MVKDTQFVAALGHGLDVLECFSPDEPLLSNARLSHLTGMPRSSVSRLTHTLVKTGHLEYDSASGGYRLGLRLLSLQSAVMAGADLAADVLSLITELASRSMLRVLMTAYDSFGLTVVQRACVNPVIDAPSALGFRYGIPRRAMGRAYVATCSDAEQRQILDKLLKEEKRPEHQLHEEFDRAVAFYRAQGYCLSLGEARPGNHSISTMLNLAHLGRRVTLSCGGPAQHVPETELRDRVAPQLLATATAVERLSADILKSRAQRKPLHQSAA